MSIFDEAFARINCYGIGSWLETTLQKLNQSLPPIKTASNVYLPTRRNSGLVMKLAWVSKQVNDTRDAFVLARVEGDATAPILLGLDPATEAPRSASGKLSTNTVGGGRTDLARGDRRVSFFLEDGRVVELRFNADLKGFDRVLIARLGEALDWRNQ